MIHSKLNVMNVVITPAVKFAFKCIFFVYVVFRIFKVLKSLKYDKFLVKRLNFYFISHFENGFLFTC